MNFKNVILGIYLFVLCLSNVGTGKENDIEQIFVDYNVSGTMVIQSLDGGTKYIHNKKRAREQFMPAATFEIPLTLIALTSDKIEDKNMLIRWDGRDKGSSRWNRDHTLESAFKTSCQWYFQAIVMNIGEKELGSHLRKINYGNKNLKYDFTMCWFDGRLEISALEQVDFLRKFYNHKLPYSGSDIESVIKLMPTAKTSTYELRGKKGIVRTILPNIGWYVGFIKTQEKVYLFATNMDLPETGGEKYPWTITKQSLKVKGLL